MTGIGMRVYGMAAVALGLIGLVWDDFALVWQPVPASVPGRALLAYATAAVLVVAGAAVNQRRTAAWGGAMLAALFALGIVLLHAPLVAAHPLALSPWGGVAEQLALVVGGALAYAASAKIDAVPAARIVRFGRLALGLCCLVFGAEHFRYAAATAALVPKWLPFGQLFWAYATGIAHIAAGLALLSGISARLAAMALTAMFAVFAILVHAPLLMADRASHMSWVMNAINLALTGAVWSVADSYRERPAHAP